MYPRETSNGRGAKARIVRKNGGEKGGWVGGARGGMEGRPGKGEKYRNDVSRSLPLNSAWKRFSAADTHTRAIVCRRGRECTRLVAYQQCERDSAVMIIERRQGMHNEERDKKKFDKDI